MDFNATLKEHVKKSTERLSAGEYKIENLFQPADYGWQGDWEGRALLAFCNIYRVSGVKIPALTQFFEYYPKHLNKEGFLGNLFNGEVIEEEQLAGHGWLLCGLLEYYDIFKDKTALKYADDIINGLYLKTAGKYKNYPKIRETASGGVSGNAVGIINGWKVSSDVGCAFIALDGLTKYYALTKDPKVLSLVSEMAKEFIGLDRLKIKAQTHATLTGTRGLITLYGALKKEEYLTAAIDIFDLYLNDGMTYTYENFNWFNRFDSWTEPCAVVDSFLIACKLYDIKKEEKYKTLARRIFFNGLQFCHRDNGGAGPNTCVYLDNKELKISMYEAPFCCNMRYASVYPVAKEHKNLLDYNGKEKTVDSLGRRFVGDILTVKEKETGKEFLITDLAFAKNDCKTYLVVY